jgi:hypothetical protein
MVTELAYRILAHSFLDSFRSTLHMLSFVYEIICSLRTTLNWLSFVTYQHEKTLAGRRLPWPNPDFAISVSQFRNLTWPFLIFASSLNTVIFSLLVWWHKSKIINACHSLLLSLEVGSCLLGECFFVSIVSSPFPVGSIPLESIAQSRKSDTGAKAQNRG